ncbi:MAG: ATP-binding protein [Pseudomonadota bacterium]
MHLTHDFLSHDSELGSLMRDKDWAATPLGPTALWPESLKHTLRIILASRHPMLVWWGPDLYQFYNDAYRCTIGAERHPAMLGEPGRAHWGEVWDIIGPQIESIMDGGEATFHEDELIPVTRHGRMEYVWWNYGYSPVRDADGVRGVLVLCTDVTASHNARNDLLELNQRLADEIANREVVERQQSLQLRIADKLRGLGAPQDIARAAFELLGSYVPATQMSYAEVDPSGELYIIRHAWRRAGPTALVGQRGQLRDFGQSIVDTLRCAIPVNMPNIEGDHRTADNVAHYATMTSRSCLIMPIVKSGRLVAMFMLHQSAPHSWAHSHSLLIQDIADRVWIAMELASAQVRHAASEEARAYERGAENDRLKSLFAQAPGFMVIFRGATHVYEFVNTAYTQIVGERPLVGLTVREALPELAGQGFFERLDQAFQSGEPCSAYDVPLLVQRVVGQPAVLSYIDFVFQPIVNAIGGVTGIFVEGIDATERHVTKVALEVAQQRLGEGMAAARMAIWDWELGSERILFSQNTTEVFGRDLNDVDDVWQSVFEEDLQRLHLAGEAALSVGGTYEEIVRIVRPGTSEPLWVQIHGKFLTNEQGVPHTVRCVAIDVTNLKFAERALQEADRRKDEFLAMLAHELRNPLAPIRSGSQLLSLVHGDSAQVKRIGAVIARQAAHMTGLINDLLDVSRVSSGLVTLDRQPQNVAGVISDSIEQVMPLMQERRHHLTFSDSAATVIILGDRKRLVQAVTNLLQNSAKYTPDGGTIAIGVDRIADDIAISVVDNGVGMTSELLPRVFELFAQEKQTSERTQGGLGLGLTLVQRIVTLHGGRVTAESAGTGQGSRFTLFLPVAPPP